jgi:protein ImuB
MSKLYACIISGDAKKDKEVLLSIARRFSYSIETLEEGVLFDVSGLQRLVGAPQKISQKILGHLKKSNVAGSIAVADTVDTAVLLAHQNNEPDSTPEQAEACTLNTPETFQQLPLKNLQIEEDTLNVFNDLGIRRVEELLQIPEDELVNRYGQEFMAIIDVIRQNGRRFLKPNVKENSVAWAFELDFPVEDFEQLIFILNHGLDKLFSQVSHYGLSTEHLDVSFKLRDKKQKDYEIKASFPTLEKTFWLKLINLRISLHPPESGIVSVNAVAHFTRPRPAQKGLYAVSRPEPESLLLTVNKLKKLVDEENVGVPVLLDERLAEAFALDADKLPAGKERLDTQKEEPIIAFNYFHPPVQAEVSIRNKRLISVKTQYISGNVKECSGVWRQNSRWWNRTWSTEEWDVEIENGGVYRLCKVSGYWFLVGEYD